MARLSNCGKSETGGLYGQPGDQTTTEYHNINYWSNGWTDVFRYPSESVASAIALYAEHAAANDHCGYSQSCRTTMWQQMSFLNPTHDPAGIKADCNADCSSSTMAIIRAVGLDKNVPTLASADVNWTTYNMIDGGLENLGFQHLSFTSESMLQTGDILMTRGHACIVISGNAPTNSTVAPAGVGISNTASISAEVRTIYMTTQLPIIKPSMARQKREDVRSLQGLCNAKGARITADGYYGIASQDFIRKWQEKHPSCGGVDGEVGARTWKSLIEES